MHIIYLFKRKYGDDYSKQFGDAMKSDDYTTLSVMEAKDVNNARSVCRDYWRAVMIFRRHYEFDKPDFDEFSDRYFRFKKLVEPLDCLEDYNNHKSVYKFWTPRRHWSYFMAFDHWIPAIFHSLFGQ